MSKLKPPLAELNMLQIDLIVVGLVVVWAKTLAGLSQVELGALHKATIDRHRNKDGITCWLGDTTDMTTQRN
jgi:hypothetical protein